MKGRSPFNTPKQRKKDIYQILVQTGGEARWKTLKAHLKELQMGPTTLKQTLDKMYNEGSIIKEPRLGPKGAEVWYKITTDLDEVGINQKKNTQQTENGQNEPYSLDQYYKDLKEKASQLKGKEKSDYLQTQMGTVFEQAMEMYAQYLSCYVRGAQFTNLAKLDYIFDYYINGVFLEDNRFYQKMLAEYPAGSLRAIHGFLLEDESKVEEVMRAEEENRKAKIAKNKKAAE